MCYGMNHLLWEQLVTDWLWPRSSEHMAITTEESRQEESGAKLFQNTVNVNIAFGCSTYRGFTVTGYRRLILDVGRHFIKMSDTSWSRNLTGEGGEHCQYCYCLKDKSFVLQL